MSTSSFSRQRRASFGLKLGESRQCSAPVIWTMSFALSLVAASCSDGNTGAQNVAAVDDVGVATAVEAVNASAGPNEVPALAAEAQIEPTGVHAGLAAEPAEPTDVYSGVAKAPYEPTVMPYLHATTGPGPGAGGPAGDQTDAANQATDGPANAPADPAGDARPGSAESFGEASGEELVVARRQPGWMADHMDLPRTIGPDSGWFTESEGPATAPEGFSGGGGCQLLVASGHGEAAGSSMVRLNVSARRCKNLYLAHKYDTRPDFVRLLGYLGVLEQAEVRPLATAMADPARAVSIEPVTTETTELLEALDAKLESESCETIEFLGVQLACFNKVAAANGAWKEDNLRYMIPYITIAAYSSSIAHRNLMLELETGSREKVTAHGVLEGYRARLFDATNQALLCSDYGDSLLRRDINQSRCPEDSVDPFTECYPTSDGTLATRLSMCNEVGMRAHSFGSALDTDRTGSFYCPAMLGGHNARAREQFASDFWFKKFEMSTIPYHETLHAHGRYSTNFERFTTMAHLNPCPYGFTENDDPVYPTCAAGDSVPPCGKADWDWRSIHGSQISLLLSMSLNDALGCDERRKVYENAQERTATKLCQPVERSFEVPAPRRCMAKLMQEPPPATPAIPAQVRYDGCETTF